MAAARRAKPRLKGTIDERPNGTFRLRVYDSWDRKQKTLGHFATLEEATVAQMSVRWVTEGDQTWAEFIDEEHEAKDPDLAERTVDLYRQHERSHILPFWGDMVVAATTSEDVLAWWKTLKPNVTRAKVWRRFAQLCRAAVKRGLLVEMPDEPAPSPGREQSPEPPLLEDEVVVKLIDATPPAFRALPLLAAGAGLRFGEVCGLLVDRNQPPTTLYVQETLQELRGERKRKQPKSAAGTRPIHLSAWVAEALSVLTADHRQGDYVVKNSNGRPPTRGNWSKEWAKVVEAAGAPPNTRLHWLRHWHLTTAASTPGITTKGLMQQGGHASPAAALRYQHAAKGSGSAIAKHVGDRLSPPAAARPDKGRTQRKPSARFQRPPSSAAAEPPAKEG